MHPVNTSLSVSIALVLASLVNGQCLWDGNLPANDAELRINGDLPQVVDPANHVVMLNTNDTLTVRVDSVHTMGIILLGSTTIPCATYGPIGGIIQQVDVGINVLLDGINPTGAYGNPLMNQFAITPFLLEIAGGLTTADFAFQAIYYSPVGGPLPLQTTAAGLADFGATYATNYDDLGDDDARFHGLIVTPGGIDPLCVATYNGFNIGSNGQITFGTGSIDFTATLPEMFAGWQGPPTTTPNPGISVLWTDLNRGGGPALGGSNGPVTVIENPLNGDVTVTWQNNAYWSSQDPAGSPSITFKGSTGFTIDHSATLVGNTSTDQIVIGWTDGDDTIGNDIDLTVSGGFPSLIGGGYVSPSPNESIGELIQPNTVFGFTSIDVIPIGPAQYVVTVL